MTPVQKAILATVRKATIDPRCKEAERSAAEKAIDTDIAAMAPASTVTVVGDLGLLEPLIERLTAERDAALARVKALESTTGGGK